MQGDACCVLFKLFASTQLSSELLVWYYPALLSCRPENNRDKKVKLTHLVLLNERI
jgi:hypothetical protein